MQTNIHAATYTGIVSKFAGVALYPAKKSQLGMSTVSRDVVYRAVCKLVTFCYWSQGAHLVNDAWEE